MKKEQIAKELAYVKGGNERYFGVLRGQKPKPHGLAVARKRIEGPLAADLQEETGNKSKPITGRLRYDAKAKQFIFLTLRPQGGLESLLKEALRGLKLSIGKFTVDHGTFDENEELPEGTAPPPGMEAVEEPDPGDDGGPSKVAFAKSRLAWEAARKNVKQQIETVKKKIHDVYKDDERYAMVKTNVVALDGFLDLFNDDLNGLLDAAMNEAEPVKRRERYQEAKGLIQDYRNFLNTDKVALKVDGNPFVAVKVRQGLLDTLAAMETNLKR